MTFLRLLPPLFVFAFLLTFTTTHAADETGALPEARGKDLLMMKCFQCHNEGMWKDHRQDRRGWQGALYRMVGRGALWTEDEIKQMADYLGTTYGKK